MQNCCLAKEKNAIKREKLTAITLEETEDSLTSQFPDMMTLDVLISLF